MPQSGRFRTAVRRSACVPPTAGVRCHWLHAEVPDDAFTASILGTDRTGNGVAIRDDGLVLTIGYLIIRNFYSVSISGYRIARAGANPISQLARLADFRQRS